MFSLRKLLADVNSDTSLIVKVRNIRYVLLWYVIQHLIEVKNRREKINILDVGGTPVFWRKFNELSLSKFNYPMLDNRNLNISILNLTKFSSEERMGDNVDLITGDGLNIPFRDGVFDLVVCHSVIEHVGNFRNQKKLAHEIVRVSKCFFVQTPSYYIPLEPHFLIPYFQILPRKIKVRIVMKTRKIEDYAAAEKVVDSIRLLKKPELLKMFPNSIILTEKLFFFPMSYILIGGLSNSRNVMTNFYREINTDTNLRNTTKIFKFIVDQQTP